MPPHMIFLVPFLNSNARVQHVRVSLALVPALVDGQRYFLPGDLPPPQGLELRALSRPRLNQPGATPRAVSSAAILEAASSTDR
jgi:hypothetical protein